MASQFVRAAKVQAILFLWFFAAPILGILIYTLSRGANETTYYFWIGLFAMLAGYSLLLRSKWDQIQAGDFFTWGLSPARRSYRPHYFSAHFFMVGGFVLAGSSGII